MYSNHSNSENSESETENEPGAIILDDDDHAVISPRAFRTTTSSPVVKPNATASLTGSGASTSTVNDNKPSEIKVVAIGTVKPHPRNAEIYGHEKVDEELVQSIKNQGIQAPIIVSQDYTINAGHRRYNAALATGLTVIPIIVRHFNSENAELAALLDSNRQRVKTNEMLGREAQVMLEIEKALASNRKTEANKAKETGESTSAKPMGKKGKSRDEAGKALGLSGPTVDQLVATVKAIDELTREGKKDNAEALRIKLNKSVRSGYLEGRSLGAIPMSSSSKSRKPTKLKPIPNAAVGQIKKVEPPIMVASQYSDNEEPVFPDIETHGQAMKVMSVIIEYVEDLIYETLTKGQHEEWMETIEALRDKLSDVNERDLSE